MGKFNEITQVKNLGTEKKLKQLGQSLQYTHYAQSL